MSVTIEHREAAGLQVPARRNLWVAAAIGVVIVAVIVLLAVRLTQAFGVKNTANRNPIPTVSVDRKSVV